MSFYNEIIPNLYLGSIEASQDFNFISKNNISIIVNCSKDIDNKFSINLLKPIEEAPEIVQKWLFDNSYYIKYYRISVDDSGRDEDHKQLSLQESIKFVLDKKPNVFFFGSRINFMNALLKFEKDINN